MVIDGLLHEWYGEICTDHSLVLVATTVNEKFESQETVIFVLQQYF